LPYSCQALPDFAQVYNALGDQPAQEVSQLQQLAPIVHKVYRGDREDQVSIRRYFYVLKKEESSYNDNKSPLKNFQVRKCLTSDSFL